MSARFVSWLAPRFERFIAVKRSGGAGYTTQADHLAAFDRYLIQGAHRAPLRRDAMLAFVSTLARLSPRGRDNVVSVVWQALRFARRHGARIEALPPPPPKAPSYSRLREPRIVRVEEIRGVLEQARTLSGSRQPDAHRAATYPTLIGLLFATGMRIGEALGLDEGDVDLDAGLVTIRRGKFGKRRVLPVRECTLAALQCFMEDSRRPAARGPTTPLFVSSKRRRLSQATAWRTFKSLCRRAGLAAPLPSLHDLRHSFAVLSVAGWYREDRDINALLPVLSTYLGHVSVQNTRSYLRQNGLLLEHACRRFTIETGRLDQVLA
jgi:integrase